MQIEEALKSRRIEYTKPVDGEVFIGRPDGLRFYVREYNDGSFDWCANGASNVNLMDYRKREKRSLSEVLWQIDKFIAES